MEIARSVQNNLEAQLEQYEKLLHFAEQKSDLLSKPSSDREVTELNQLVKSEVQVVSLLQELEVERQEIVGEKDFDEILEDAGNEKESLLSLKQSLKGLSESIRSLNQKNTTAIKVSLKIINKMIDTVRNLASPRELTYSRVRRPKKNAQSFQSLNLTV